MSLLSSGLRRRSTLLLAAAAALAASACSEGTIAPTEDAATGPSLSQYPELASDVHGHIMHTREWFARNGAKPGGSGSGTGIYYHGGPVLQSGTRVAAVYWAGSTIFSGGPTPGSAGSGSQDGSLVGYFLGNLGGSPYFGINTSYTDGAGTSIANAVSYTQYWANNTNAPSGTTSVSDAQMVAMLQSGFDSGKLTYDDHTLYAIFTSGKVNLGGGFGTQYCAYHTHGTVTVGGAARTVLYAAMPYNYAYPSACTSGLPAANGDPGADYEVNTLAHEVEETTTDMMGTAWFDRRGYENADKCAWSWGATYTGAGGGTANIRVGQKDFLVQQNWVNAGTGGCALHL